MTSVFLSYARRDDEPFVARVYEFLRAHGFAVWYDRKNMPARGLTFNEEIRDAIHASDRVVVVIGPEALRSEYVRAEWQAALSERKPVVTAIRRVPEGITEPHACLPPELKWFHAELFLAKGDDEPPLDLLVRLLSEPIPPPPSIPGRRPERPPHYLPRPDAFSRLFAEVLGETLGPTVKTNEGRITVVTGMGGIGKSVLAWSLVEAMRSRPTSFLADGIYWLTGDALRRLASLCHVRVADLADDRDVSDALAGLLEGKRFLLVVDNATSVDQIAALARVLGPGGRMLVTTRHGELAVGHRHVPVDQLSEEEALRLVADWMGTQPQALPPQAQRVVKLCGYHPFAIALNAAAAKQGLPWSAIVKALEQRELDYAKHRFEEYVYETVDESLRISLDALPKADRTRYLELAAFFWDGGVPAAAILRLWKRRSRLAEHHALRLLAFLQQRSLLRLHGEPEEYEVRLHDLHLMHIGRDEKKAVALGRALLDAYRPAQEDWWSVADDDYLHRCLVRHLLRSQPPREALALVSAEDDEGRNAWYRARVHGGRTAGSREDGFPGYVADLALVSAHAADCLFVLVAASLRSLARAVPAALLAAAVTDGGWSLQRAMARARLVVEPEKRARAMIALLARVEDREPWLDETLDAIDRSYVTDRNDLMQALAPVLDEAELLPVLRRVMDWSKAASTPYEKNHTRPLVWPVLDRMPASLAAQGVAVTDAIGIPALRLYGMLEEPQRSARIDQALAELEDKDDAVSVAVRARRVSALAEHLDPAAAAIAVGEAHARARRLELGAMRSRALASLLRHLPPAEQRDTMRELLDHARANPDQFEVLARDAPVSLHADIRAAVVDQPLARIAAVAPLLSGEHRRALMNLALTRIEASDRAASLLCMNDAKLLLAMNDAELGRARKVIDAQLEGDNRVAALIGVARAGSDAQLDRTLQDVVIAIDALGDLDKRERAYEQVAPLLSPTQIAAALTAAERIGEPSGLGQLVKLLQHLSAPERRRATGLIADHARREGIVECHRALLALPCGCEIGNADALVGLALELDNRHGRAHLLAALAPRVSRLRRKRVAADARTAIGEHDEAGTRIELLLEMGAVDDAEVELHGAASAMDADQLAKFVAMLAGQVDAARAIAWVNAGLALGARGKHVLETLAPHLSAETALAYLAKEIRPMPGVDDEPLYQATDRSLPFVAVDDPGATAGALARRLGALGLARKAFELVRLGRDDEITASALVELSLLLPRTQVLEVERRMASAQLGTMYAPLRIGRQGVGREYLAARLAPALAHAGEVERALRYAGAADEAWRIDAYLGIAEATAGETRSRTLLQTLDEVLAQREVWRNEQIDGVARAIAGEQSACAKHAWSRASDWARSQPRKDAIEVLASMAPVAAAAGGSKLTDEVFRAIERAVRWWP